MNHFLFVDLSTNDCYFIEFEKSYIQINKKKTATKGGIKAD